MDQQDRIIKVDINDPFLVEKRVKILMGNDASVRRQWVEENVDFNQVDTFMKEAK